MARVVVELDVDADGAVSAVRAASSEFVKLGRTGASTGGILDVALGNVAARAAERLLSTLGRLGPAAFEMALAADDIEAAYRDTFDGASDELDAFLREWGNSVGETDAFAQEIAFNIAGIGQGFGMATDESEEFARRLLTLARDLTSRTGKPIEQSISSLRGVVVGNMESLREQFGISIPQADAMARAMENTGKTTKASVTQQEVAIAALDLAYERAGKTVGDYERTQDSAANSARRGLGELRQHALDLARTFMPIFEDLTAIASGFLEDNQEAIQEAIRRIGLYAQAVYQFGKEYAATVADIARFLWEHKELVGSLAAAWGLYKVAVNSSRIAQALLNLVMRANPLGLVVTGIALAIGLWVKFKDRVYDAAAALAEWGADAVRVFSEVSVRLAGLAAAVPQLRGSVGFFAGVAGGAEAAAERLDGLAASARRSADDVRAGREEMTEAEAAAEAFGGGVEGAGDALDRTAGAADKFKTALEQLRKKLIEVRRTLRDLRDNHEAIVALQAEVEGLEMQREALEENAEAWARWKAVRALSPEDAARLAQMRMETEELERQAEAAENLLVLIEEFGEAARTLQSIRNFRGTAGTLSRAAGRQAQRDARRSQAGVSDEALGPLLDGMEADFERWARLEEEWKERARRMHEEIQASYMDLGPTIRAGLGDAITALSAAVGEMLAGTAGFEAVGAALLGALGRLAVQLGEMMIGFGLSAKALRELISNPTTAIIAGGALVALGVAAQAAASSLIDRATGGGGGSGGSGRRFAGDRGPQRGLLGSIYDAAGQVGAGGGGQQPPQPPPVVNVELPPAQVIQTPEGLRLQYQQAQGRYNQTRGLE